MRTWVAAVAALLAATSARAEIVYSNNFDTENGGASAQNYALPGFDIVEGGFDLVHTGDGNGVTCRGGSGGCLDLAGTGTGPGWAFSDPFSFNAGDLVTLRYSVSGNQRTGTDGYGVGFAFYDPTSGSYTFIDGLGVIETGTFENEYGFGIANAGVPAGQEFRSVLLSFRADTGGRFNLVFDGLSPSAADDRLDDFGLILDDVSLDITAVPEPATWALMIAGFAMVGAGMRRRDGTAARVALG